MRITEKDVLYVAGLANLELAAEETARLVADMDSILGYVEKLNELDTTAVEAMAQVLYEAPETLTLREDSDRPGLPQEKSLGNAPESGAGQFKVAKVIER
ncbi:MAG: glutamyl-tRNA amidotransferase [Acidobacteria bacterium RIFCSPLOWO2_12_FULL_60_22]|nr:MAG: glutamyl-tRNA amidotransferase [Acidobacteria bacterium RIFCSPLOWO2_12_FULL_60_22]